MFGGGFLNAHTLSSEDQTGRYVNAYGYMYMQDATPTDVVDFNREKDGQIHDNTPNLANPILTSDVFTIAANGLGGAFRAFRSDIPVVRDRRQVSTQDGTSVEAEIAGGTWAHGGVGEVVTVGSTTVSSWEDQNELLDTVNSVNAQLRVFLTSFFASKQIDPRASHEREKEITRNVPLYFVLFRGSCLRFLVAA